MVCSKTGRVIEFYDEIIERRQQELAAQHGFKITGHSLILYGEFTEKTEGNA
jgi:Fur family ferric uptake transcriptional regulator